MLSESRAASRAIHRCCSLQDTPHVPPEYRRFRRVHGLQLPLHPQQVIGWVLLVVVFSGTFAVLTTPSLLLPPELRLVLTLVFAALFLVHVLAHLTVLLLDPADPEVRARPASEVVPEFDRSKHRHVIENGRCHLCNITTHGRRTKHCSICNKCVPRFDHHCKWLNNCIGGRNYPAFLACLVSTLVAALAVVGLALCELVLVNARVVEWGGDRGDNGTMNNATASSLPVPGAGSLVLVTVIGVLSAIAAVLLIHLCFFHGYIACLGLTTYEYVRSKREKSNDTAATAGSRTTSFSGPCGAPHCAADGQDVDVTATRGLYRFCENGSMFRDNAANATTDVFVCSTHEERDDGAAANGGGKDARSRLSATRSSRNFRLCFSYDSRTTETSIEVSSQTTGELRNHADSPDAKSSTPSPVSCCFSIMSPESGRHERNASRKRRTVDHPEAAKRSCGTMRRIQTFLQARWRKGSLRQRSTSSTVTRPCGNKVIPAANNPLDVAPAIEDRVVGSTPLTTELTSLPDPRPPARLPALDLPPRAIHKIRAHPGAGDISVLGPLPPVASMSIKRNPGHLRTRRNTFSRKRPRFKVGSHITQTAQLSPIPESEFSKPATPRSPSRSSGHFAFPPLRE